MCENVWPFDYRAAAGTLLFNYKQWNWLHQVESHAYAGNMRWGDQLYKCKNMPVMI